MYNSDDVIYINLSKLCYINIAFIFIVNKIIQIKNMFINNYYKYYRWMGQ